MAVLAILSLPVAAESGVFLGTVDCAANGLTPCGPLHPQSNNSVFINPYGIIHPQTFQDSGGTGLPNVRVCIQEAFSGNLSIATAWAAEKWNALEYSINNCRGCSTVEAPIGAPPVNLASTVLHELGHCVFGLSHQGLMINVDADPERDLTSYTISYGGAAAFIDDGPDNVRGSADDSQPAGGGGIAEVVEWFRILNNDPINIPVKFIDGDTYSRAFADFPSGTFYSANANKGTATLLGQPETQSVMWIRSANAVFFGLSADDVNQVLMARTGLDRQIQDPPPPAPGDDYAIGINIVPCADPHEIEISAAPLGAGGQNGKCDYFVDFSAPNPPSPAVANSYKMTFGEIQINSEIVFEFSIPMFYGSFESGDFIGWDGVELAPNLARAASAAE